MDIGGFFFWAIIGLFIFYVLYIYNHLVGVRHKVTRAWSNIDVLLKQRHDEIPKLVETSKQYMKFEKETLEKVMEVRNQVSAARQTENIIDLGISEGKLRTELGNLFLSAEAYPELKADENFQHIQGRISSLESAITDRRVFYNDSVNINNTRIEQFPDLIIAKLLHFSRRDLLVFKT